ncbi:MAG: GNAT family N-acetyltransferase [Firmicutes bacterium]|nr:GNAT family N-acetyltransferase [Bacillota bacterium]
MKYITRAATLADVPRLREIEMAAMPHSKWYSTECAPLFIEQKGQQGEMVVAELPELPDGDPAKIIGMGQYSVMPDGSGWLECLRILPEYQRTGAGRQIYERYQELWNETDAPHVAMFTGRKNVASKALSEVYGFEYTGAYDEYSLPLEGLDVKCPDGFVQITDLEIVARALDARQNIGDHIVFNRTYLHYTEPIYRWLIEKGMVWSDGENLLVLGARMLEERGWYLAFWQGDLDICLAFSIAKTKEASLPALTVNFPPERTDLVEYFESKGFHYVYSNIVMELNRR